MRNIQQIDSNLQLISRECIKINIDVKDIKILVANLTDALRDYIKIKEITAPCVELIKQTPHIDELKQYLKKQASKDQPLEFEKQIQNMRSQFKKQIQAQIKKNSSQIQKSQRQMQGWKQKIQKYFVTKTHNLEQKMYIIEQSIKNDIVVLGEPLIIGDKDKDKDKQRSSDMRRNSIQSQKFQDKSWFDKFFATKKQKDFSLKQWLDEDSFYIPNLIQIGDTITTKDFSYIFGKKKLTGQSSYTVTFSKVGWRVALGVIDSQNHKKSSLSAFNQNSIWYWNDGDLYISGKLSMKGRGYSVGQTITVVINTLSGIIQWKVITDARIITYSQMLTNQFITWVPFIYLYSKLDSVIISG